jgi:peroxiredoxin
MKRIIVSVLIAFISVSLHAQKEPVGLALGELAPAFIAQDQNGQSVHLDEQLKKGPVVLVFYRGQWCPYCNRYLKHLEDSLQQFQEQGATVIAITPEKPENISQTIEKTNAQFPILYDEGLKIMKAYDVAYAVDEKTISKYKGYGIDFNIANGEENGANLPVPAVYVIDRNQKIVYRHFNKDYTKRAPTNELMEALRKCKM